MSSAVIEVVLGLIFVYFIFSMICSGINEAIARILGKRSDLLLAGIWSLLDNSGPNDSKGDKYFEAFQEHPLVRQLGQAVRGEKEPGEFRRRWGSFCRLVRRPLTGGAMKQTLSSVPALAEAEDDRRLRPSYIPPAIFEVVVTTFLREENDLPNMPRATPATEEEDAEARRRRISGSPLEKSLQALVDEAAGDAARLRASIERWYDSQMERVSGWYKREAKQILFILATAVVLLLNVDTISIARTLWTNPLARSTLADAAEQQLQASATTTTSPAGAAPRTGSPPAAEDTSRLVFSCLVPAAAKDGATTTTTAPAATPSSGQSVERAFDCAKSLPIPLGWGLGRGVGDTIGGAWDGIWAAPLDLWVRKLLGWGLTTGALTLGAPFWFDLLNRFGSLRAAGSKPKPSTEPS